MIKITCTKKEMKRIKKSIYTGAREGYCPFDDHTECIDPTSCERCAEQNIKWKIKKKKEKKGQAEEPQVLHREQSNGTEYIFMGWM